MEVLKAFIQAF